MNKHKGFTLVELLVVIGIISILISILLPALNKVRQSAWRISCQSQMRQVAYGMLMYANENNGCLPALCARAETGMTTATIYSVNDSWIWLIARYIATNPGTQTDASDGVIRLMTCPAYHSTVGGKSPTGLQGVQRTYCISDSPDADFSLPNPRPYPWYGVCGLKVTRIRQASEKALVFEIWYLLDGNLPVYKPGTNIWTDRYDRLFPLLKPDVVTTYNYLNKAPHSSDGSYGANVAFADGHVAWVLYDSAGHLPKHIFCPLANINP